jgi:hypothetical protein
MKYVKKRAKDEIKVGDRILTSARTVIIREIFRWDTYPEFGP